MPLTFREWLVLICVILVFVLLPFLGGGRDAISLPIVFGVLLLTFLFLAVDDRLWGNQQCQGGLFRSPIVWLGAFLIVVALGMFFSVNRYETSVGLLEVVALGAFFLLGSRLGHQRRVLALVLIGSAALTAVLALAKLPSGISFRIGGSLINPNALGGYLILPLFLALAVAGRIENSILRWCVRGSAGLFIVALLVTFSVTAWVAVLFGCITWWFAAKRPLPRRRTTGSAIVAVVVLAMVVLGLRWMRLGSFSRAVSLTETLTVASGETSINQRWNFLLSTWHMFLDRPWIGGGYNTWGVLEPKYQRTAMEKPLYAHSWYAQTIAETGVVGGVVLLGFLASLFAAVRRALRDLPPEEKMFGFSMAFGCAATAIHGGIDFSLNFLAVSAPLFFFAGVIAAPARSDVAETSFHLSWTVRQKIATGIGGCVLLLAMVTSLSLYSGKSQAAWAARYLAPSNPAEARDAYEQSLRFNPDPNVRRDLAELIFRTQANSSGTEQASEVALRASKGDPYDARTHNLLGEIALAKDDPKTAEQEFRHALALDPYNNPPFALNLALVLSQEQRWKGVQPILTGYLRRYEHHRPGLNPDLPRELAQMNQYLGEAALQTSNTAAARKYFQQALKEDPTFPLTDAERATLGE
ncbi:MAG: O-antigen ligase family protein [bacterium]